MASLAEELRRVNEKLWEIEDQIRAKERDGDFDAEFIKLARSVYKTNDSRMDIKRKINMLTDSRIKEEKSYQEY